MKILKITVKRQIDDSPDTKYLGEYSNKPAEHHIDRQARGEMDRGQYRYFNLGCGDPEYIEQDYERSESLNRGDWYYLGITAEAEVILAGDVVQRITSGGLWGIESDSGDYLDEIEKEQLQKLRVQLAALDFDKSAIDAAFAQAVDHVNE